MSIISAVFVAVAFFAFYVNKKAMSSRADGLWLIYPVLGLSSATVVLLGLSTMQREGCNHGSGFFLKIVEVFIYIALLFQIANASKKTNKSTERVPMRESNGDFSGAPAPARPVASTAKLEAEAKEFDPIGLTGQLSFA